MHYAMYRSTKPHARLCNSIQLELRLLIDDEQLVVQPAQMQAHRRDIARTSARLGDILTYGSFVQRRARAAELRAPCQASTRKRVLAPDRPRKP